MEKNLLKKFKKKLTLKNRPVQEIKLKATNTDKNSVNIINNDVESYFLDVDEKKEEKKPDVLKKEKPLPKKSKFTKQKTDISLKTNKNKIPVIDSKEDLISAFGNNKKYRVKTNKVVPKPKKFEFKEEASIALKPEKNKNGIKILTKEKDLSSYFNDTNIDIKTDSFKTDTSILRAKKGVQVTKQKLPIKKRLEKYPEPEKTIDLHGYTSIQAKLKTENFIRSSWKHGYFTLRIITGKGIHSQGGAVLPDITKDLVNELIEEKIVLSFKWENISKDNRPGGSMIVYLNRFDQ